MNKKLILVGILLLVNLTFSGCVWYGGHGYGYHGYSHGDSHYGRGYERPYGSYHDRDDGHDGSGHGLRRW